jgi:hypothetical protein
MAAINNGVWYQLMAANEKLISSASMKINVDNGYQPSHRLGESLGSGHAAAGGGESGSWLKA